MSGQYQFPPSSPNLGAEGIYVKEALTAIPEPVMQFATPNPSSSGVRSSSPIRNVLESPVNTPTRSCKVKIVDPLDSVHHLRLPSDGSVVYLGRSSKSCNFPLSQHNKRISRVHLKIRMLKEQRVELRCVGWNGVNVSIPQKVNVKLQEEGQDDYIIEPSRIIAKENRLTNFYILKDESIVMPLIEGVLMDLSGELVLLEYEDKADLTDDEHDIFVSKRSSTPIVEKATETIQTGSAAETTKTSVASPTVSSMAPPMASPSAPPTPLKALSSNELNRSPSTKKKPRISGPTNKRHKAEGLYDNISQQEVDKILAPIADIDQVENVLVNHLAFSRLSSTPLSTIKSISHSTENLNDEQLRVLLMRYVECVGVIYRIGKDAAGKPLDEEYYYIPEKDTNLDRTQLVANLKGESGGLRSCRKTHKQYFWRKPAKK
ncbi:unnamed protein product [Kuraishia capsulata CBS 1993]|uniref:FHA domain-containing protein n=1 Tax=Kuraishia capsulata CBS 1993 TaxID=1382522 RepID=W6MP76_9ASCO|nr:uncharacterized protein KUCA_T00002867001 [Kuraishia capsulata CBS 1993]CDK26892.1 unnamed protein product [Kuraishia capsulata CBS 1993]